MRTFVAVLLGAVVAAPAAAQQANPFKIQPASKPIAVSYQLTGSMTGTAEYAAANGKFVRHSKSTGKFFGKTSSVESWSLYTPDEIYTADLIHGTGDKSPNMFPAMAKAYDKLSADDKSRFGQNMKDMAQMISQAFGASGFQAGDVGTTTATYAGHTCVERTFGSFSSCNLKEAPQIPLHTSGSMMCVDFEQTATSVNEGSVPSGAFDLPAGIQFKEDSALAANSDSMARSMVRYMASQELADSLAKARQEMASHQQVSQASAGSGEAAPKLSKADCEKLRNLDLGTMVSNSLKSVFGDAVKQAVNEREQEMKAKAQDKVKALIKKPKLF